MTWTEVPDKAAGDVFTEAMWDTYIRDNLNKGVTVKLAEVVLASDTAYVEFASIPQTFRHLMVLTSARASHAAAAVSAHLQVNGDGTANYDLQYLVATNTTVSAASANGQTVCQYATIPGSSAPAGLFSGCAIEFPDYRGTLNKLWFSQYAHKKGTGASDMDAAMICGCWRDNDPITQIRFYPNAGVGNFVTGSVFTLLARP